jgi:hypothetical protein
MHRVGFEPTNPLDCVPIMIGPYHPYSAIFQEVQFSVFILRLFPRDIQYACVSQHVVETDMLIST